MLATCPNFVISVENAFLDNGQILALLIATVKCRNPVSVIFVLLGFLIEQRIHVEAVNSMTEPTMNTKIKALDDAGAGAGSQENALRPE